MPSHHWSSEPRRVRLWAALLVAVLAWGTLRHVLDLVVGGLRAHDPAPAWLAGYWFSLTVLDPVAAVLVVLRRRTGLVLAAAVLVTDALANGYATYVLGMGGAAAVAGHLVVTTLAVATTAALPRLWPRPSAAHPR